jgi:aldose sugar dehydrogenase
MEQPVYYWNAAIAHPGMTFYTGKAFPNWQGSLLIASLRPGLLVRWHLWMAKSRGKSGISVSWRSALAMYDRDRMACSIS